MADNSSDEECPFDDPIVYPDERRPYERHYMCPKCGKKFKKPEDVNQHIRDTGHGTGTSANYVFLGKVSELKSGPINRDFLNAMMGKPYEPKGPQPMNDEPLGSAELGELANFLIQLKKPQLIADYTNYRGERSTRTFEPIKVWYGSTEYHPEPCLLLKAFDLDKGGERDFKMADFDMNSLTGFGHTY